MARITVFALTLAAASLLLAAPAGAADPIGDVERGAALWRKCASCHAIGKDAKHKQGPHLNGIFGRKAGGMEDFGKYSTGMRREGANGLVWDLKSLHTFIENPKSLVSKTKMKFRGIKDPTERADLIAFLRAYSDNPRDIPESAPTAIPSDPEVDAAILAIDGDPAYGEYLSSECLTCHRSDGSDQGIPSITGWPRDDFVTVMHAYKVKARPNEVMQLMAGKLSNDEIAALAAFFAGLDAQN